MDTRSLGVRIAVVVVLVVVLGAGYVGLASGGTTLAVFLTGFLGLGTVGLVISRRRGTLPSRIAGLVGCVVSLGLATLAYMVRSLCWGDPDAAARSACETQWAAGALILVLIGASSLAAGFWPTSRTGARQT
jgi:hypothetical protein